MDSSYGYRYQEAQDVLHTEPGQEVNTLNEMTEMGIFERQPVDRIHLCPFYHHFALNFREVCPQCSSHFINQVEMIHHYACGFLSYESQFVDGTSMTCPKCRKPVLNLGVDYERAATNYRCDACAFIFPEPDVACLSIQCGQSFGIDGAILQSIYAYRLTKVGEQVAAKGVIEGRGSRSTMVEESIDVYTFLYFEEQLTREIQRASRYHRPFSLLLLYTKFVDAPEPDGEHGREHSLLKTIVPFAKKSTRDCDVVSLYQEKYLLVLLPETEGEEAAVIGERIGQNIKDMTLLKQGLEVIVAVGMVEFSGVIDSSGHMIEKALNQLLEDYVQKRALVRD